jgi:hypothetical protein
MVTNTSEVRVQAIHEHVTIFDLFDRMGLDVTPETQQMRCPFHTDSNPSARVYAEQNKIYCFTCQRSWDVIDATQEHFGLSFQDALGWLEAEFAVPGGMTSLAGTIRTKLASRAPLDVKAVATMVEDTLKSRREQLGYTRYSKCLYALDLTVWEATERGIKGPEVQRRMSAILKAAE